jgi:hypothetical protein
LPKERLLQAGLLQGSPLSPILFLFFNADLVQQKIDGKGGAIAFVDDYSIWVVGLLRPRIATTVATATVVTHTRNTPETATAVATATAVVTTTATVFVTVFVIVFVTVFVITVATAAAAACGM